MVLPEPATGISPMTQSRADPEVAVEAAEQVDDMLEWRVLFALRSKTRSHWSPVSWLSVDEEVDDEEEEELERRCWIALAIVGAATDEMTEGTTDTGFVRR